MQTYSNYNFDYNEYKKKTRKRHNYSFLILTILVIALMVVAFFIKPTTIKVDEYYFARINTYLTYSEASKTSIEIQNRGGAGYIYFDGRYHVLTSFYTSKDDAESVVNNLKTDYPNASIYTLEVEQFKKSKKLSTSQNKATANIVTESVKLIDNLYTLLLQLDKSEISTNELSITLANIIKDYNECCDNYKSAFPDKNANIITSLEELEEIKTSLNNIKSASTEPNYKLKYELASIVFSYSSFLSCF